MVEKVCEDKYKNKFGRVIVYVLAGVVYLAGLYFLALYGLYVFTEDMTSSYGAEDSWQRVVENSTILVTIIKFVVVLFIVMQLIPWLWVKDLHRVAKIWISVLKAQATLGVGSITLWIALNSEGGESLVRYSTLFAVGTLLAGSAVGLLVAPVLVEATSELPTKAE